MSNTATMCKAINPANCAYHGLELGMEVAIAREDYHVYEQLRAKKEGYERLTRHSFTTYPTDEQLIAYGEAISVNHLSSLGLQAAAKVRLAINYASLWEENVTTYNHPPTYKEIKAYSELVRRKSEERLVLETALTHINDLHSVENKIGSIIEGTIHGYAIQAALNESEKVHGEGLLGGKIARLQLHPSGTPGQLCLHYNKRWLIEPKNSYFTALFTRVNEYLEIFV